MKSPQLSRRAMAKTATKPITKNKKQHDYPTFFESKNNNKLTTKNLQQ
jgi:hypothetical protein